MSFKSFINKIIGDDDIDQFDDEDTGEELSSASSSMPSYEDEYQDRYSSSPAPTRRTRAQGEDPSKVVDIHTTAKLQVVLSKPEKFEDAREIADNLNDKRTVVLNLEATNRDVARRLVDFLTGVAYANGGQLKRVANNTFIITPYNVDVSGDLIDELENTGVFF